MWCVPTNFRILQYLPPPVCTSSSEQFCVEYSNYWFMLDYLMSSLRLLPQGRKRKRATSSKAPFGVLHRQATHGRGQWACIDFTKAAMLSSTTLLIPQTKQRNACCSSVSPFQQGRIVERKREDSFIFVHTIATPIQSRVGPLHSSTRYLFGPLTLLPQGSFSFSGVGVCASHPHAVGGNHVCRRLR